MNTSSERDFSFSRIGSCARNADSVITRLMAERLARPEMLSLAAGFTDNRVLPESLVKEAVERLSKAGGGTHLQYGMNAGRPLLRQQVVDLLRSYPGEEALSVGPENVIMTNGSQQALYITVQMLCDPGDIVLVESPSYFVFLELLSGLGIQAVSLPVNEHGGLDIGELPSFFDILRESGDLERVKLVYLMGTYANPSTLCIEETEKRDLGKVLAGLDRPIPVLEDMAYRELYFERPFPARSLLALPEWNGHPVLYTGTFTKPFATGLKIGFLVTRDKTCLSAFARIKGHQDFGSGHFNQAIIEAVLDAGAYPEYLASIRRHYAQKRDLLEVSLIENGLRSMGWEWHQPKGGLLLWMHGPRGLDTRMGSTFHQACLEKEILYVPGDLCFAEGWPWSFVRLSFGALESELIPEAVRRFCAAASEMTG